MAYTASRPRFQAALFCLYPSTAQAPPHACAMRIPHHQAPAAAAVALVLFFLSLPHKVLIHAPPAYMRMRSCPRHHSVSVRAASFCPPTPPSRHHGLQQRLRACVHSSPASCSAKTRTATACAAVSGVWALQPLATPQHAPPGHWPGRATLLCAHSSRDACCPPADVAPRQNENPEPVLSLV